jgi:ankyrin repeat protein
MTALTIAVSSNQLAIAKILLDNGADKNIRTINGLTVLDIAETNKNGAMEELLGNSTAQSVK